MKIIILLLACVAQIAIPASMIYEYESTLQKGKSYRFEVRPVDPADPFRGRYVRLGFEQEQVNEGRRTLPGVELIPQGQNTVYALLDRNDAGLAVIQSLSAVQPESGDYIVVTAGVAGNQLYSLNFPFDRYYANELKAPSMETAVRARPRLGEQHTVTAQVHVHHGRGVISQLWVGEQTIEDFLLTHPE